jgi:hypothetical protein
MAALLIEARDAARDARHAGKTALAPDVLGNLVTAAKWGISKLDALRDLFNGHAWMPPGLEPSG